MYARTLKSILFTMTAVFMSYVLSANSASANEFVCTAGKRPPTNFNWGGGFFGGTSRKRNSEQRTGKLAFTVRARTIDEFSLVFMRTDQPKISLVCIVSSDGKGIENDGIEYYTYFVDFPIGEYKIQNIDVTDGRINQRNEVDVIFNISSNRVTYIGSYNIVYAPVPLENKYLRIPMGVGGWRLNVGDERDRDFKAIDPENAYAAITDEQIPRP